MERHGLREDESSARRRVSGDEPVVYGSLDICEARDKHVEGCKAQKGNKTRAIHMLVQFPPDLIPNTEEGQQQMMAHAVKFANDFHGGDAVFAARLDRDEAGTHKVDVFLMPRYEFAYKDGRTQKRTSVSKFAKEQAKQRYGNDDRRSQGSALQDAFHEYLCDEMGLEALPPKRKKTTAADRVEPEVYALRQEKASHSQQVATDRRKLTEGRKSVRLSLEKSEASIKEQRAEIKRQRKELEEDARQIYKDAAVLSVVRERMNEPEEPAIEDIRKRRKPQR